jgi:predicted HTH domain antitoxin
VDRELRLLLAVKLFELGRVSLGQAAEMAGRGKVEFIDELGRLRVPLIDYDDLDAEFEFGA